MGKMYSANAQLGGGAGRVRGAVPCYRGLGKLKKLPQVNGSEAELGGGNLRAG